MAALILLCVAPSAHAFDFDGSFGRVFYTGASRDLGDWRQPGPESQGFRDDFNLTANAWSLGATGDIAPTWKWRAGYADLGTTTSAATATRRDTSFDFGNGVCVSDCAGLTTFAGVSKVSGVYLTAVKSVPLWSVELQLEGGAWVYKNELHMWTYAPPDSEGPGGLYDVPTKNEYRAGLVLGFGVAKGNTSLNVAWYDVRRTSDEYPSINDRAPAYVVALRQRF